jgi:glycosyltransferase involved in cell wall biosynthesis
MADLVSILIPAYNAEKWIQDTIRSAINQTWPRKEIIVVDDGSLDNTLQIAKRFESTFVKVVTQPNMGASAARNRAMSLAQGDYIQWLDADDLLAPDKISQQLNSRFPHADERTLLSSGFGTFHYRPWKAKFIPNSLWQDMTPLEWITTKFEKNIWMNPAVWVVSRDLCEAAGPWDERLTLDDDGEYFCRVVAASRNVRFIPEARAYYRLANAHSLSRATSYKACESLLLSLSLSFSHLLSLENSQRTRDACLKYLAIWFHYFYPEKKELVDKVRDLAHTLGGKIDGPTVPFKYRFLSRLFGWQIAKEAMTGVSDAKLLVRLGYDWVLSKVATDRRFFCQIPSVPI